METASQNKACHDIWQNALKSAFRDAASLLRYLQLSTDMIPAENIDTATQFPLFVSKSFAARMKPGDPNDPLLLQVLNQTIELAEQPGFSKDPINEAEANPIPGLLHKYHNRVLVTLTGACAINCRYCFRRHFPYQDNTSGGDHWQAILDYIQKNTAINEVIFSGGDPLLVKDQALVKKISSLEKISHLKRLRIHTRIPIALPERITPTLCNILKEATLPMMMAIHTNHPQEIDDYVRVALKKLSEAGVMLMNQSVLLKNVNDHADTLIELSEALFDAGVMPYYIHLLDKVQGAAHFDIPEAEAKAILWQAAQKLPGYLVPKLVKEIPGEKAKVLI